ncbi:MAG: SUMF1/EgtB/PvdO family nonheme iron enzyme [Acidobacteriota bacterium]
MKDLGGTSLIAKCSSCSERLDTGSLYCKACGAASYTEQTAFGVSALLCGACNSYSPVGSQVCRMCGAAFGQGSRAVDFGAAPTVQQKAPTLPDLNEQMQAQEAARKLEQPEVDSGAKTWVFTGTEHEDRAASSRTRGNVETNLLPGTAGSRSEQQAPTSVIDMGRITGPVEERDNEAEQPLTPSGELRPKSAGIGDQASPAIPNEQAEPADPRVGSIPGLRKPTTSDFGSEGNSPAGSESKTEVFVSPLQPSPPPLAPPVSQDGVGTRQFVPQQSPRDLQGTREFQPPGTARTPDLFKTTEQRAIVPEWNSAAPMESSAVPDLSQPEVTTPPLTQVPSQPLPQKRTGMAIASVVVALIVIGGAGYAAWWFIFARVRPAPPVAVEPPPVQPPVIPAPPEKPPAPVLPEGMVAVAAGTFTVGRDNADPLEQPQHKVDLAAFFIDRTEVTNAAYKKFLDATGHEAPTNWTSKNFPNGRDNCPVTGVTWQDAADYAAWAGKRLPTETEWEAAARGADGRIYPWGNDYRAGAANIGAKPDDITADLYPSGIKEVARYPLGASPAGTLDMIGNAWEWVSDEMSLYPGNTEAKLTLKTGVTYRVIRGGAYDGNKVHDATYRGYLDASEAYPKVGFRCAKDAK